MLYRVTALSCSVPKGLGHDVTWGLSLLWGVRGHTEFKDRPRAKTTFKLFPSHHGPGCRDRSLERGVGVRTRLFLDKRWSKGLEHACGSRSRKVILRQKVTVTSAGLM
jgi:hypothetical protein